MPTIKLRMIPKQMHFWSVVQNRKHFRHKNEHLSSSEAHYHDLNTRSAQIPHFIIAHCAFNLSTKMQQETLKILLGRFNYNSALRPPKCKLKENLLPSGTGEHTKYQLCQNQLLNSKRCSNYYHPQRDFNTMQLKKR